MAGRTDNLEFERQIGSEFANRLMLNLRRAIKDTTKKKDGLSMKSTASAVYKNNELHSLLIKTPYYIYPILDLGFEGSKKKGINFRVEKRDILIKAIENGRFIEKLADQIGDVRAAAIISRVSFGFDKDLQTSNSLS